MAKITIPLSSVQITGTLHDWFYNNVQLNSEISNQPSGGNLMINDINATNKLVLSQVQILNILTAGGEVEEYLAGIRAPNSLAGVTVPSGLPDHETIIENPKNFEQWISNRAELWTEDAGDEFIFYTNPHARSRDEYLTASQMEIIRQLNTTDITILTVAEVQAVVASGWTKRGLST